MGTIPPVNEAHRFSQAILQWFDEHGRNHLPWQQNPTSYRVWVSEIMLQQTQVTTVIPYFEKFMARFPDVETLAAATQDEVLNYWSGLGYYARGRNLHKAANLVVQQYHGRMPESLDGWIQLPGIGRSTAGAILSLAQGQNAPILDGNVKRVLCRHYKVDGWYGQSVVEKYLWKLTTSVTPEKHTGAYNQAMMDLGATLCTRSKPDCVQCPVRTSCAGFATGNPQQWPHKKPKRDKPRRVTWMVIVQDSQGRIFMQRRPPIGIWGGLWSFAQFDDAATAQAYIRELKSASVHELASVAHTFTHFQLTINPVHVRLKCDPTSTMIEDNETRWVTAGTPVGGVPAPVSRLIEQLSVATNVSNSGC